MIVLSAATMIAAAQTTPTAPPNPAAPDQAQDAPQDKPPELPGTDPKWLERLPKEDRAALVPLLGYAPPEFTKDVQWFNTPPTDWARLRGKVIVVQSWTTGNTAGRGWPARVATALKEIDPSDVVIIALHTPENADGAENFMKRQKPPENVLIAIDPVGAFCDALGIYKHPVNLVIDRNGMVRYAGLNINGLKQAVAELVAQPYDRNAIAPVRQAPKPAESAAAPQYPPTTTRVIGADDWRGKRAPDLMVDQWYTAAPNLNRVLILSFWGKSDVDRMSPHAQMNSLASQFGSRSTLAVIAEESRSGLEEAMAEHRVRKSDFQFALALDRNRRMANAMNVTGTPHAIIISRDWVVRWQGRISEIKRELVEQILEADAGAAPTPGTSAPKRRGWVQSM